MKFIETLKNIYRIEELRSRILFTLGLILVTGLDLLLFYQELIQMDLIN